MLQIHAAFITIVSTNKIITTNSFSSYASFIKYVKRVYIIIFSYGPYSSSWSLFSWSKVSHYERSSTGALYLNET